ncbi:hypothetical protein [Psychroflexus lacisalsi]|uniref:Uncharacterized protein n=1 Tax=Psychroflexus lacisalsi TaxID=503928 RepID=A0ABN1K0S9_9FLAO|nr:hypothetical protein [Psychroflexus lacisalsi]MBZ9620712.1 hypothetical protein [Psychroflexus lacisalsi]
MKHMERFKKLMRLAEDLNWIEKNPTKRFKLRFDHVDMVYLSKAQLQKIKEMKLKDRLTKPIATFLYSVVIRVYLMVMSKS